MCQRARCVYGVRFPDSLRLVSYARYRFHIAPGRTSFWTLSLGFPCPEGNTTVLTVVDRFSKMVHFIPLPKLPIGCSISCFPSSWFPCRCGVGPGSAVHF